MGRTDSLTRSFAVFLLMPAVLACASSDANAGFMLVSGRSPAAAFLITPEQAAEIDGCYIQDHRSKIYTAAGMIEDFNDDLYECAGCRIPVVEFDDGVTHVIRFRIEERPVSDLDRFGITFPDERTMLITGSTTSLRWALNHILREFAGVRFLSLGRGSAGAHFPEIEDLRVPGEEISVSPSFNLSRASSWLGNVPYWNSRMGNHGTKRIPRGHQFYVHAFPVRRYISEGSFPDYIFPVIGGKKYLPYEDPARKKAWSEWTGHWGDYGAHWQPCLTDPRTEDEAVRNIIDYFDRNPGAYGISMTINDNGGFCECEDCRAGISGGRNHLRFVDYSNLYFSWLNRVVERVSREHPDRYYGVVTYRETASPPDFDLHERVVPFLLYDAFQGMDADVMEARVDFFRSWAERAEVLGARSYPWGWYYDMPRVYFKLQQEMLQLCHGMGARAASVVSLLSGIAEGPKNYLYQRLFWDVDLDLEETLREWYEACVGDAAAPYLAEYYSDWERIWAEEAVKTSWFQRGKHLTYLNFSGDKSYLYALGADDLPRLRGLMERVVELAGEHGDERQKTRAGWLMRDFEYAEACGYAMGGDKLPPAGVVEDPSQAFAYLEFLPRALWYDEMRYKLHAKRAADPDIGRYFPGPPLQPAYVPRVLAQIGDSAAEPEVMRALIAASGDERLPSEIRGLLNVFARMERDEPVANLMLDGRFEEGNKDFLHASISQAQSYRGKNSLRRRLPAGRGAFVSKQKKGIEPGRYYVSAMVYIESEHPDVESYVFFRVRARCLDGMGHVAVFDSLGVNVPPGEWTRISLMAEVAGGRDMLNLGIYMRNYSEGDVAYIDDVVIVPLNE